MTHDDRDADWDTPRSTDITGATQESPRVARARVRAAAYVWGFQDARRVPADSAEAGEFADAYAEHIRAYEAGQVGAADSMKAAFRKWRRDGRLR